MAGEVKSAQITISEIWHDHVHHKTVGKSPRWDAELGVVCACGEVLGWPDPEHKETLSQYTKRVASERVDAASAPGRVKGAFGTYGGEQVAQTHRPEPHVPEPEEITGDEPVPGHWPAPDLSDNPVDVRAPGDYPEPEQEPPSAHDDDPGPGEPEDASIDWGEPPADEPEPEVLAIEDGDGEDVGTAPFPADAVPDERGNMISDGKSYGPVGTAEPADEAQAEQDPAVARALVPYGKPWADGTDTDLAPEGELIPWDGSGERPTRWQDSTGVDWVPPENATAKEIADAGLYPVSEELELTPEEAAAASAEGKAWATELVANPEVGRDLVPYRGTPIMPTDAQQLDPLIGRLPPLDPTLPYTPQDVELKIVEVMLQLENSELFLRQQLARLHQATHNHDFRYNLALAKSDQRAADQRKAEAWLATEKERHEMTEADMLVRALRDSQHNLRSQLSGFQSVARSLAVSMVNSLDGRERPPLPPEPPRYN